MTPPGNGSSSGTSTPSVILTMRENLSAPSAKSCVAATFIVPTPPATANLAASARSVQLPPMSAEPHAPVVVREKQEKSPYKDWYKITSWDDPGTGR